MRTGKMYVDYKMISRDMKKSVAVKGALVDPSQKRSIAPMHWLEALRSPSERLPRGYYTEEAVYVPPPMAAQTGATPAVTAAPAQAPNAIRAGPLVMFIVGQTHPVAVEVDFVNEADWNMTGPEDCDLRVGRDAIEQCPLFCELRPGGLLSTTPVSDLKKRGLMVCGLSESPLVPRPWTRMKHMQIDELQRGPEMTEFVGHNPRTGSPHRFSQHTKYFRIGIWREITRRNDLVEGQHLYSSFQRSPQQSVPEVRFMAPTP